MSDRKNGFFLTVEGIEGAGKTSIIQLIETWLIDQKIDYLVTREPGGTPLAEKLRQLILSKDQETIADSTELLLMFAARMQNLHHNINPALQKGQFVLSDRFTDATYAYQGGGRQLSINDIQNLEQMTHKNTQPNLTILLDLDPKIGLKRVQQREQQKGAQLDRIEQQTNIFFHRVRQAYLDRAEQHPDRIVIIDTSHRTLSEVSKQTISILQSKLDSLHDKI